MRTAAGVAEQAAAACSFLQQLRATASVPCNTAVIVNVPVDEFVSVSKSKFSHMHRQSNTPTAALPTVPWHAYFCAAEAYASSCQVVPGI